MLVELAASLTVATPAARLPSLNPMAEAFPQREKIRILWLLGSETVDPAAPRANGVEVLFGRMAPVIERERFEVSVAYPEYGPMAHAFDEAGCRRVPFHARWNLHPALALDIERMVRTLRPHVVHSNSGPRDLFIAGVCRLYGAAHLTTRHVLYDDMAVERWRIAAYKGIDHICFRIGTHIAAIAEYGRRALVERDGFDPARVHLVRNGHPLPSEADLLTQEEARRQLGVETNAPVIGMAGRLVRHKGAHVLLEAAARLSHEFPRLLMLVAGSGPEKDVLEQQALSLGLGSAVRFLGFVRNMGLFFDALDCFVLPSLGAEGVPNVLCEALGRRRPCVASAVQGVPEVVVDGTCGLLVPPGDPEALAQAIGRVLRNRAMAEAWGEAGRRWVAERFSLEGMARAYEALYEKLAMKGA